ncbi:MAG: hypothetical protein V3S16_01665 [Candidatus Desulfatibia sp.]
MNKVTGMQLKTLGLCGEYLSTLLAHLNVTRFHPQKICISH